ncbi:MAG TPA: alpha-L-fucosidase [Candidatus Fimadaptatus faecigallinarum]|uniref:alpha-L-fucosidase n=1 Tax=Candidatus Fimadaptatus faecigallinarum TaxID=2840814 RepID=A0A9D1S584_9FIRM|nr:alpha-L-fucosidase [Candidatus Fimadaptatus faecigallinarum]
MFDRAAYEKRVEWFKQARFGMFIHWGLYAIPARGEWIRSVERISVEDYQQYFDEFNPVDYDPRKWARACKQAGMQYAVLTAKHHDGFCLFDSALTDYKSTTCCGRDLVREYLDAFRAEGIRVGLYYSIIDWHHPDFPHYGDKQHPERDNPAFKDYKYDFDKYLEYMHGQIRELCTNYGKIDIFWFDFSYDDMRGEKWKATELVRMIRSYQPDVLMDNRLEVSGEGFGSLATQNPSEYSGDFVSPEQIIPPEGVVDDMGKPVVWESCITMNNNWGYNSRDDHFKTADMIIKKLVECVSKGGNMLLNVGPDARGNIPEKSLEILRGIGDWMRLNSESIYGCGRSLLPRPDYGRVTQKGKTLYFHVNEPQIGFVPLAGIKADDVKCIRLLRDGSELKIERNWITNNYPDIVFVSLGENPLLPDPVDTVIKVELK